MRSRGEPVKRFKEIRPVKTAGKRSRKKPKVAVTAMKSDGGTAMTMELSLYISQRNDLNSRNLLELNDRKVFSPLVVGHVKRELYAAPPLGWQGQGGPGMNSPSPWTAGRRPTLAGRDGNGPRINADGPGQPGHPPGQEGPPLAARLASLPPDTLKALTDLAVAWADRPEAVKAAVAALAALPAPEGGQP